MNNFTIFLQTLKIGDEITLVFYGSFIKGKIEELDEMKTFIRLSNVNISGTQPEMEITLFTTDINILAWGKK